MHMEMSWSRQEDRLVISAPYDYQTLTELRRSVVDGIDNAMNRVVTEFRHVGNDDIKDWR